MAEHSLYFNYCLKNPASYYFRLHMWTSLGAKHMLRQNYWCQAGLCCSMICSSLACFLTFVVICETEHQISIRRKEQLLSSLFHLLKPKTNILICGPTACENTCIAHLAKQTWYLAETNNFVFFILQPVFLLAIDSYNIM